MFIFVFLWTPAITQNPFIKNAPYGLIFSLFMIGCMCGSQIFTIVTTESELRLAIPLPAALVPNAEPKDKAFGGKVALSQRLSIARVVFRWPP